MSASEPLLVFTSAKINLTLSVGAPVPPRGYHPIASWFAPIGLTDEIRITRLDSGGQSRHTIRWQERALVQSPIDWPVEKDLAVRAHRLLERRVGGELPVEMDLRKSIPVGGGLGGGSSDAAGMLVGINEVFGLGIAPAELRAISVELGSDVAFFIDAPRVTPGAVHLTPRSAMVEGFGERIERVDVPSGAAVLFFPPFGCPTADVYRAFDRVPAGPADGARVRAIIEDSNRVGRIEAAALFNDLGAAARVVEPRLARAIEDLQAVVGPARPVHVSGSGSTLFTLVAEAEAKELQVRCRAARPDVASAVCGILQGAGGEG